MKLCYVSGAWAYFTDQFEHQWGDDWNDAPYEHNAGDPYPDYSYVDGKKIPCKIMKLAFDGPLDTPSDLASWNSPYSVQDINGGRVPWLVSDRYSSGPAVVIPAGTDLKRFCELVKKAGGDVYLNDETRAYLGTVR